MQTDKVRVLVCGDGGVGKKKLIHTFVSDKRPSTLSAIGIDVQNRTICVGDKPVKLQIWNTAGQERFNSIPTKSYQRADGVVLVYDVTRMETFDHVTKWLEEIKENVSNKDVKIVVVGNKIDLTSETQRTVNHSRGKYLASTSGTLFFETSAKTGENVEELFHALASAILNKTLPTVSTGPAVAEVLKVDSRSHEVLNVDSRSHEVLNVDSRSHEVINVDSRSHEVLNVDKNQSERKSFRHRIRC